MAGRECYHCKQWIEEGEPHDCWTTTEAALTAELSEDLRDAWERLRETAAEFGEQRIYASHKSIMFSRKSCYFFVRPKRKFLEVCMFLGRPVNAPQMRRVDRSSKSKIVHTLHITHRDEVEAPVTEWLREAYELSDVLSAQKRATPPAASAKGPKASKKVKTRATATSGGKRAASGGATATPVRSKRVKHSNKKKTTKKTAATSAAVSPRATAKAAKAPGTRIAARRPTSRRATRRR